MKKGPFYRKYIRPVKHGIGYIFIVMIMWIFRVLPRRLVLWKTRIAGKLGFFLLKKDRRTALKNIEFIYPGMKKDNRRELAKNSFAFSAMNFVDIARLGKVDFSNREFYAIEGREYLDEYIEKYGGGIVITGHIGCFEMIPGIVNSLGYKVAVIGRKLYDPRVDDLLVRRRESAGIVNLASDIYPRRIIKMIKEGFLFGILMDTNTRSVEGQTAPLFGHETRTISGPITIAYLMKIPVLPMAIYRRDDGTFILRISPWVEIPRTGDKKADIQKGLELANSAIERMIDFSPKEWIWYHERYPEHLEYSS